MSLTPRRCAGLSLLEVCVVLALVALMACMAWPSWSQASRKSRRAEAISALLSLQQAQEQRYAAQGAYTDDLVALGWPSGLTASGGYRLEVTAPSAAGYLATARVVPGSDQSADTECHTLAVRWVWGQHSVGSTCSGCAAPGMTSGLSDPARCWAR